MSNDLSKSKSSYIYWKNITTMSMDRAFIGQVDGIRREISGGSSVLLRAARLIVVKPEFILNRVTGSTVTIEDLFAYATKDPSAQVEVVEKPVDFLLLERIDFAIALD